MATIIKDKPVKSKVEREAVSLPSNPITPPETLSESVITIYGRKGIGKTSLAAMFPGSLVCMFERGRRNLAIHQVPEKMGEHLDWNMFKDYVELFIESDKFQTLVIDTIDRAYDKCLEQVCKDSGCKHPSDKNDWGKTWGEVRDEFDAVLGLIQDSGKGLIFISHETAKPLTRNIPALQREDSETVFEYRRMEPSCSKQAFEIIEEICDFVLYYSFVDEYRTITVRSPNDIAWTSCGMERFLDPDGAQVRSFKVGSSAEEAYSMLLRGYNGELRDMNYVPPRDTPLFKKKGEDSSSQ